MYLRQLMDKLKTQNNHTVEITEKNQKKESKPKERKLFFGSLGPYSPLYNPTLSHYTELHQDDNNTTHHVTHSMNQFAGMNPYMMGMFSPYMSMAHLNPMMTNPAFFGFNPLYQNFLGMNMMSVAMGLQPYMMNPYLHAPGMANTPMKEATKDYK